MTVRCPFCSGTSVSHRMTVPLDCKTFRPTAFGAIHECSTCSAGFVHPRPTSEETNAFYELDSYYTQGRSHMPDTGAPGWWSKVRTHLAWRVDKGNALREVLSSSLPAGASIVDIGCGAGDLLREMNARGYRAIGVERDAGTVSRNAVGIEVLEGSAEKLPAALPRHGHDAVVFSHVIEHLVDPLAAVRRAALLVKPGGLLVCEVPNNQSTIARQSGAAWEHLDTPRHINFFNERALRRLMEAAGLATECVYFNGYNRYFHDAYIATEQRIFDAFVERRWRPAAEKRNSAARSWALLGKTAFASPNAKYDSVGIVARVSSSAH